jgi:hypothetical protein
LGCEFTAFKGGCCIVIKQIPNLHLPYYRLSW